MLKLPSFCKVPELNLQNIPLEAIEAVDADLKILSGCKRPENCRECMKQNMDQEVH